VPPYRVAYSELCRDETRQLLARAAAKGRFAEVAQIVRDVNTRLEWAPVDVGDPLRDLVHLGAQERIVVLPPLVVAYAVDETRRLVYVSVPFKLLPKSGL
jgi:hypothetical protein